MIGNSLIFKMITLIMFVNIVASLVNNRLYSVLNKSEVLNWKFVFGILLDFKNNAMLLTYLHLA